ncbi:MAG: CDP-alcohol phosphatidyltransferase family protein [Hahellaceae bacterium]|nr:CDP-alcohol phosphatidyltransferase family protein [Hahellaceae bacterium]
MVIAWRQIPNLLTFIRILLIVPFAISLYVEAYRQALLLFFVAGLSDGVDGFLARKFNWQTRFGAIADPLADKLLLVTAYVMLCVIQVLPWWLSILIISRDLLIVGGGLAYHYMIGPYEMRPSWLGKLNTLLQITYVLLVIIEMAGLVDMARWIDPGLWLVTGVCVLSGGHYLIIWGRRGWQQWRDQH